MFWLHTLFCHEVSVHFYSLAPTRNKCLCMPCLYHTLPCSCSQVPTARIALLLVSEFVPQIASFRTQNGCTRDGARSVVIAYRRFGTNYQSHLQGSRIQKSVRYHYYPLLYNIERRSSHLLRSRNVKSPTWLYPDYNETKNIAINFRPAVSLHVL